MNEGAALFDAAAQGLFAGFLVAGAVEDDLGAEATRGGDFDLRRGQRHDDLGANAKRGGVEGDALGVVAGAGGDDAAVTLHLAEGEQLVERATLFEGAGELEVFKLQVQRQTGQFGELVGELAGRNVDGVADARAGCLDAGEGDQLAVRLVEGDGGLDVDVGEAVAVGHQERVVRIAFEVLGDAAQAASGAGVVAGVDQGDAPRLGDGVVDGHLVVGDVEGDVGGVQEVVGEVLLDDVALVAEADNEVVDALLRVELEDVPENGASADLDHGLGTDRGFFAETRAETTG